MTDLCSIPGSVSAVFLTDDQDSLKERQNESYGETHPFKTQSGMDSVLRPWPGSIAKVRLFVSVTLYLHPASPLMMKSVDFIKRDEAKIQQQFDKAQQLVWQEK